MSKRKIILCRVYETPPPKKGLWFLVDRLWPRGLKKDKLPFDAWLKEIAPSPLLRKWFNHEPDKWVEFANQYVDELKNNAGWIEAVLTKAENSEMVLFYAAKSNLYNHARVLKAVLESWPKWPEFKEIGDL